MAYELPMDLIEQVQITLRTNAGLSSYDPHDPTLPPIPSSDATIAGLDPSPPYLRCKHCKGKLLRGLQSVICIHCGKPHRKDVPPDPISFNSTLGYQWLLQSLHFDGSEAVGASAEESTSNRVQNSSKEKISLSELLDLQIAWSDEPAEPEIIVTNKSLPQSNSTQNLSSVELGNFFSGSERDAVNASEEPPALSNQVETTGSKAVADPENLSLFHEPSQTGVKSSINASSDAFTGWEADFQSADSGDQHDDFKSVDPFAISKVDLSAHMDSVFGSAEDSNNEKLNLDSAPHPSTVGDLIPDIQLNNVNPSVSQQADLFDAVVEVRDGIPSDSVESQISQIADNDWFQDTKWQNSSATSTATNTDDDLFGVGTMSTASPSPLGDDWIQDKLSNNIQKDVSQEEKQFDSAVKANDLVSPDNLNNPSVESVDVEWFQDTKWQENNVENMTIFGDDAIFGGRPKNKEVSSPMENDWIQHDLLNNISSSDSRQDGQLDLSTDAKDVMSAENINKPSSDSADWFDDSLWQVNTVSAKDETVNKDHDSFDDWNDFASLTSNQDSLKSSSNQSGNEIAASSKSMPHMNLLMPTNNFQEVDFSSFSQSDLFSGLTSNEIGTGEVNKIQPEVSTTNRTVDAKVGESSEKPEKNADVNTETPHHQPDDIEMLMSQMHDLSFMLESNLSVPSKPDGL